jgi:hypothetical protein
LSYGVIGRTIAALLLVWLKLSTDIKSARRLALQRRRPWRLQRQTTAHGRNPSARVGLSGNTPAEIAAALGISSAPWRAISLND